MRTEKSLCILRCRWRTRRMTFPVTANSILSKRFLFVSKMDSAPDVREHESSAKRIKLDHGVTDLGELCNGGGFPSFSTTVAAPMDSGEAISVDCDSGYEASTLESIPASSHQTSPQTDSGDVQENLSEIFFTPSRADQTDTSQDSMEPDDDNASTVSHLSELSGLSDLSGQDWKPMAGSMIWIQKQMTNGVDPRKILNELGVDMDQLPAYLNDVTLWKLIINMVSEPPRRNKLRHVNTLDDVVRLVKGAQNIIVLTGAGVSVSCGIPDFRSRDGIYSRLAIDFPDLPDPQAMFDIGYFNQDPRPFFKFAKDIYPGKFKPSPCHNFIKILEKHGKLLRNYTQNIDTLEKVANIERVIECHGSFATATCTKCCHKTTADAIRDTVLTQKIPLCEKCHEGRQTSVSCTDDKNENGDSINYKELVASGIMKPDIVFFGEGLPDTFHDAMAEDKTQCDLLLVIGSSLKVRPVALIPNSLPAHVPQILINREPLPHCHFDVELMGDCDIIINQLCHLLQGVWKEGAYEEMVLQEASHLLPYEEAFCQKKEDELDKPNTSTDCECNSSTKCSSLNEIECSCPAGHSSIINKQLDSDNFVNSLDIKTKERHVSIDSARDSGIGENSNFGADLEPKDDETSEAEHVDDFSKSDDLNNTYESSPSSSDIKGLKDYWQPKIKKSLTERLPSNSFYLIKPSRYVFPGAEIFYEPDEKFNDSDSLDSSDSEGESEPLKHF